MNFLFDQMLDYILSVGRAVTSNELSVKLGITPRAVRYEILKGKETVKDHGIYLETNGKSGYHIEIVDNEKYENYRHRQQQGQHMIADQVLSKLLNCEGYCKMDDLAEEFYMSRSTLNRMIQEMKINLKEFDLTFESKPYAGIRILGSELKKRLCLAKYNLLDISKDTTYGEIDQYKIIMRVIVYDQLLKFHYKIKDISFENLLIHLVILVNRVKQHNFVVTMNDIHREDFEYQVGEAIAKKIEEQFQIEIPENEICYIVLHLQGKQSNEQLFRIDESTKILVNHIFDRIENDLGYDFHHDIHLYTHLLLHFKPMLIRIKNQMNFENHLLENIKSEMRNAYDCALLANVVIQEELGHLLSEDEVGYLALHFSLSLQRDLKQKYRILVICSSGTGTSNVLKKRISLSFDIELNCIDTFDYLSVMSQDLSVYDYIFSTIQIKVNAPVIFIDNVFTFEFSKLVGSKSKKELFSHALNPTSFYTDLKFNQKKDVLAFLGHQLIKEHHLSHEVVESIIKREEISSTEIGNSIAMPHPMKKMTDDTVILVAVLRKEILWYKKPVRCIFLVCYSQVDSSEQQQLNEALTDFVIDTEKVMKFLKVPTYELLLELL